MKIHSLNVNEWLILPNITNPLISEEEERHVIKVKMDIAGNNEDRCNISRDDSFITNELRT